jgi:hypothetical protein
MKKLALFSLLCFLLTCTYSQNCTEIMNYVKSNSYGTTYSSYNSDAISKVTFYELMIDYETHYFAVVCFKSEYSFSCSEYIYKVGPNTRMRYAMDHYNSAGKAFWAHIQPYHSVLGCSPNF